MCCLLIGRGLKNAAASVTQPSPRPALPLLLRLTADGQTFASMGRNFSKPGRRCKLILHDQPCATTRYNPQHTGTRAMRA